MTDVVRVGPLLILSGPTLALLRDLIGVATRHRRLSGYPDLGAAVELDRQLADALEVARRIGHADVPPPPTRHHEPGEDMSTCEAARLLGLSERQARRMAPRLGGRKVGGRWRLDRLAVMDHQEGMR